MYKMQITTTNFQDSLNYVNELLHEYGHEPLSINEAKDWSISGGEEFDVLESLVNDYLSEISTDRAELKYFNKYEY